jgi:betaine-aldehyde dehydrogenase
MISHYPLFINGEFIECGDKQEVLNPSTGCALTSVSIANESQVKLAIEAARTAFDSGSWRRISFEERRHFLLEISKGILDKAQELARLETLNTGKPIKESTFMDIPSSAKTFEYLANNFQKYLEIESVTLSTEAQNRLWREPVGVVVLIVPWNYPLLIASWKMSQALAAGNTVILKPSSLTPLTSLELAKIIKNTGLPEGVVNIINGSGLQVGELLCSDRRVDMISFTGSNETGRQIMQYASKDVKKLIMELGGKSASIIFEDADLEVAVNGALCSIFLNQGQMCTAMSRIFIEDDIYDKFIEKFLDRVKRIRLGDGLNYQTQMGPLISYAQRKKVLSYVEKAKQEGAKLLYGGKVPDNLKKGFFFEPTVFCEVEPHMSIFKEEIFGPVVCVGKFSNIKEAMDKANESHFGLAASIWTTDLEKAHNLALQLNTGIIWINTYGMFYNELPYGGFKQSGFGKELGREGFLEYTRLKNIIVDKTKNAKPLVNYWYGF